MSKTITDATVFETFKKATNKSVKEEFRKEIIRTVNNVKICTGKLVCFYPWLNKAKVQTKKGEFICKVLTRCGGDVLDLFTPMGVDDFDETLKEPCVLPFVELSCLVVDVDSDDDEWLLLGYYQEESIIATTPAPNGSYKIVEVGALEENELTVKDYYSKSEVDAMLNELRSELNGDIE